MTKFCCLVCGKGPVLNNVKKKKILLWMITCSLAAYSISYHTDEMNRDEQREEKERCKREVERQKVREPKK